MQKWFQHMVLVPVNLHLCVCMRACICACLCLPCCAVVACCAIMPFQLLLLLLLSFFRYLVEAPANVCTPRHLAAAAAHIQALNPDRFKLKVIMGSVYRSTGNGYRNAMQQTRGTCSCMESLCKLCTNVWFTTAVLTLPAGCRCWKRLTARSWAWVCSWVWHRALMSPCASFTSHTHQRATSHTRWVCCC